MLFKPRIPFPHRHPAAPLNQSPPSIIFLPANSPTTTHYLARFALGPPAAACATFCFLGNASAAAEIAFGCAGLLGCCWCFGCCTAAAGVLVVFASVFSCLLFVFLLPSAEAALAAPCPLTRSDHCAIGSCMSPPSSLAAAVRTEALPHCSSAASTLSPLPPSHCLHRPASAPDQMRSAHRVATARAPRSGACVLKSTESLDDSRILWATRGRHEGQGCGPRLRSSGHGIVLQDSHFRWRHRHDQVATTRCDSERSSEVDEG